APVSVPVAARSFRNVAALLKQSVVNISATRSYSPASAGSAGLSQGFNAPGQQQNNGAQFATPFSGVGVESIGSGIIVTSDGYILTNFHVVDKATEVFVTVFASGGSTNYPAEVLRLDESRDLALLKIDPIVALRPAPLGDSNLLQVGDPVIAIGSPFGLEQSVSQGIVSSRRKSVMIEGVTHKNLIQADAAINQGNSGGALVNEFGYVVGVNTAIYTTTGAFNGVGFAVPINDAREFINETIAVPNVKPRFGKRVAAIVPPPPIPANAVCPHENRGLCANCHSILPAGSQQQGMAGGAVSSGQFAAGPGGAVGLNMAQTGGAVSPSNINLGGMELINLNNSLIAQLQSPVSTGACVARVFLASSAAGAGLLRGDVIFKVDGQRIESPAHLMEVLSAYGAGKSVRLSVYRNGQRQDLSMTLPGAMSQTPDTVQYATLPPPVQPAAPVGGATAQPAPPKEFEWAGMELDPLAGTMGATGAGAVSQGALVKDLDPNSIAALAGVQVNDLIVAMNQAPVNTPEALNAAITSADLRSGVAMIVGRDGRKYITVLRQ
ncbi:MAG: trypsin-like peptidase domain-containing protein, partial [Nitrospinae bacterium]|nr:trypsin-like peptidase domain-containing protein [Nitrospinota bacterium]